jgi:hypothetical protein
MTELRTENDTLRFCGFFFTLWDEKEATKAKIRGMRNIMDRR